MYTMLQCSSHKFGWLMLFWQLAARDIELSSEGHSALTEEDIYRGFLTVTPKTFKVAFRRKLYMHAQRQATRPILLKFSVEIRLNSGKWFRQYGASPLSIPLTLDVLNSCGCDCDCPNDWWAFDVGGKLLILGRLCWRECANFVEKGFAWLAALPSWWPALSSMP